MSPEHPGPRLKVLVGVLEDGKFVIQAVDSAFAVFDFDFDSEDGEDRNSCHKIAAVAAAVVAVEAGVVAAVVDVVVVAVYCFDN